MSKPLITLILISCLNSLLIFSVKAQDVIQLKTGEELKTKVVKIWSEEVEYKKFNNLEGPTYIISKDKVSIIKYQGGANDVFDGQQLNQQIIATEQTTNKNQDSLVKALLNQTQHDSANTNAIVKQLKLIQQDNKQLNETIAKIIESLLEQRTIDEAAKKKQQEDITKRQEETANQVTQLSNSISQLNKTLDNIGSQKAEKQWVPKKFGIGFDIGQTLAMVLGNKSIEDEASYARIQKIFLVFTPHPNFRIEAAIGLFAVTGSSTGITWELGMLPMYQKGKTNLYLGLKLFPIEAAKLIAFAPTAGYEYLCSEHLSFGGEVRTILGSKEVEVTGGYPPTTTKERVSFIGFANVRLLARFYF